jgi:penicillin amidase
VSAQSRRAVALLRQALSHMSLMVVNPNLAPQLGQAAERLANWDSDETTDSAAAAIYEVWASKHLGRTVVQAASPEAARALIGQGQLEAVITWLESPAADGKRDDLILRSLGDAVVELKQRLGPDVSTWTWGRLHHADFLPAVGPLAGHELATQMRVGPLEVPGSSSTPRAATYRPSDFTQTAGASVRMVLDVGGWDNSMVINTPGESGDPMSPHYRDMFPLWAAGTYVPLRYSRAAVDADAETVIRLTPAS